MNTFFGSKRAGVQGMGLADVTIMNYSGTMQPTLDDQHTPFSTEELRERYQMDGWALDFIEGPKAVLNMLCHEARINSTVSVAIVEINTRRWLTSASPVINSQLHFAH